MTYYFTSITSNYLAKARVLCKSLKQFNPDCKFALGISDDLPEHVSIDSEPFDLILFTDHIDIIPQKELFFFMHSVTEICTAVKPAIALTLMLKYNAEKVVYLDPDIMVFSALDELEGLLDTHSMIFTPHQTDFEDDNRYIVSNEILFLKRGTYNLGFFAVRRDETGIRFLNWWHSRLMRYCFDDDYELLNLLSPSGLLGLFTDQKWIDLVPAFFDGYYVLKAPGYNVSTWNMTRRVIKRIGQDGYTINGLPLFFFHFSGYDSGGHHNEMLEAMRYNPENVDALHLTKQYELALSMNGQEAVERIPYKYTLYSNGKLISKAERKILHIRNDLWEQFPNPFDVTGVKDYYHWVRSNYPFYIPGANSYYHWVRANYKLIPGWQYYNKLKRSIIDMLFPPFSLRRKLAKSLRSKLRSVR